jgi:hypothetical protein
MTPSLIRAVDRIAAAQAQAYGTSSGPDTSRGGREADTESVLVRKQRWDDVLARRDCQGFGGRECTMTFFPSIRPMYDL